MFPCLALGPTVADFIHVLTERYVIDVDTTGDVGSLRLPTNPQLFSVETFSLILLSQ